MNIQDIMTSDVVSCTPETNLASVAASMWQHDCGALPVVDENMHLMGMITDRDICIALATRNRLASDMTVREVTAGYAFACWPDEDVQAALTAMRRHRIRRVPVVGQDGRLAGIVSIDDIVLLAKDRKGASNSTITYTDAIETQKAIATRPPVTEAEMSSEPQEMVTETAPAHTGDFDFEE